jgi:beta-lactamase regulating signal transducer with metallopeptidase domain
MTEWTVAGLLVSMGLALALMLILRPVMLRGLGPRAQYLSWLLVPVFTLATMLPALPIPLPLVSPEATRVVSVTHRNVYQLLWPAQAQGSASKETYFASVSWPVLAWFAGVGVLGAAVVLQHRRWSRQLSWEGQLGRWSLPPGSSPSVVGLLRPRLALPSDFEQRFNEAERAGVLAHEEVHAKRHDNLWNLIATVFWVVNWFNPLAWWALRAFQRDQELACDAAALDQRDEAARTAYRDALLKAFELSPSSALSKGWRSAHPLIERLRWVQAGFTERTWLSVGAVLMALTVLSALAYAVHGGGIWQIWEGERPILLAPTEY